MNYDDRRDFIRAIEISALDHAKDDFASAVLILDASIESGWGEQAFEVYAELEPDFFDALDVDGRYLWCHTYDTEVERLRSGVLP